MSTDTIIHTEPLQEHRGTMSRVAAACGVAWIALTILSVIATSDMPTAADDADVVRDYLTGSVGAHQVSLALVGLSLVPLLLFAAGLAGMLRRSARRGDEGWSTATAAFFVFGAASGACGLAVEAGLLLSRDVDLDDGTLLVLWDINMAAFAMLVLGFGTAVASASISSLTNGTRPSWYGWLGVVVGIAGLLGLAGLVSDSDTAAASSVVMLPLLLIWTIITSAFLYRDA